MKSLRQKIPIIMECVNLPDPEFVFLNLAKEYGTVFLDSSLVVRDVGRYSILASNPFWVFTSKGNRITLTGEDRVEKFWGSPFKVLRELFKEFPLEKTAQLPFVSGAVGYFGYELNQHLEKIPYTRWDDLRLPDCWLGFYGSALIYDHYSNKGYIAASGYPGKTLRERLEIASRDLGWWEKAVCLPSPQKNEYNSPDGCRFYPGSNFTRRRYCEVVSRAKEYIKAGDIFQVNLSQRMHVPLIMSPDRLYLSLRRINPAPFSAYINLNDAVIACSSPERFLRVEGNRVETRPIKGTRRRGATPEEDYNLRCELINSEKDRAELIMIVDLERNDLGKVCAVGSVRVPELFRVEEYASVFHLVSTIEGTLSPGKSVFDCLEAAFPGGSITGAPKIRAMEIIDELETVARGPYTGALGYLDFSGDADLNIIIRTIIVKDGQAYVHAGGGIVVDSQPEDEYRETLDKARALLKALGV